MESPPCGDSTIVPIGTQRSAGVDGGLTGESLTIKSGKGIDLVTATTPASARTSPSTSAGNNTIMVTGTTHVGRNLTGKTGNDTIDTTGAVVVGKTKIQHGTDTITP